MDIDLTKLSTDIKIILGRNILEEAIKEVREKALTPQDVLDFYNEHITFTGELSLTDVDNWIERIKGGK